MSVTLNSIVAQKPVPLTDKADNKIVLLNIEAEQYYGMNAIGTAIWDQLASPQVVANVCDALVAQYDVDAATCQAQVLAFINELVDAQLAVIQA